MTPAGLGQVVLSLTWSGIGGDVHLLPMARTLVNHEALLGLSAPRGERPSWVGDKSIHLLSAGAERKS